MALNRPSAEARTASTPSSDACANVEAETRRRVIQKMVRHVFIGKGFLARTSDRVTRKGLKNDQAVYKPFMTTVCFVSRSLQ